MNRIRVFVGYGYHARDKWVDDLVIPFVKAFGCDVAHGKAVFGGPLPLAVIREIQSSDAMIGFTTQRDADPGQPGKFTTHPWVVQELVTALAQKPALPYVEVREENVLSPGAMLEGLDAQRITYREAERADCLLAIALALERFATAARITTVRLAPMAAVTDLQPLLSHPTFTCTCQILRRGVPQAQQLATILPIKGALFVQLRGIEPDDLVRFAISAAGRGWQSDYESVDTVDVQIKGV